jgi:hypothetical protein
MKFFPLLGFCALAAIAQGSDFDDVIDRINSILSFGALDNNLRARVSGTLDMEFYHFEQPAPALINSSSDNLFNPRLTLFADVQYGSVLYFFAETRVDRGFDPSAHGATARLDEYALRVTPWSDERFSVQLGKFATVVGNWVPRHLSWDNPFINAPLVYENVTPINDKEAPASPLDFVSRFHNEKYEFNPVIWGPNYTTGMSVSGRVDRFDYAVEVKNASLSSRPESWSATEVGFDNPTVSGRIGFRPSQMWNIGISASEGPYLRPEVFSLPNGRDISDYREFLVGQDVSFAWHHLQIWAEFYEASFQVPRVGDADTFAYYLEAKYKLAPQVFVAARWNQQLFGDVEDALHVDHQWGHDLGRIDFSVGYRFTENTQLKLEYSFQKETSGPGNENNIVAAQLTVRF